MDEDDGFEYVATFPGPCTCSHETEQHGWMHCDVDGCPCEAHWEE